MSEEQEDESSSGSGWYSWGNSWIQGAKSKTLSTLELVKKDLSEFTDAVSQQATATVGVIKDNTPLDAATAGGWMKSLVGTVNSVLQIVDTTEGEENDEIPILAEARDTSPRSRLVIIQSDVGTFANDPAGAPELFEDWLDHFNLESKKSEIRDLLSSNSQVRKIFADLVPQKMSNSLFWQRYFYKVHQFDLDQARREALLKRSEKKSTEENAIARDSWGDSDIEDFEEAFSNEIKQISASADGKMIVDDKQEQEQPLNLPVNENCPENISPSPKTKRNSTSSDSWTSENVEKIPPNSAEKHLDEIDVGSENSFCLVSNSDTASKNAEKNEDSSDLEK